MGDNAVGIEELRHTQAVALGAGPAGVVERKQSRLEFLQAVPAGGTRELAGEHEIDRAVRVHGEDPGHAVGHVERGLEGLGEALFQVRPHLEAINDGFDGVLHPQLQGRHLVQVVDFAVHPRPNKALGAQLAQHLKVLSLALLYHRRQQHEPRAFLEAQHLVDHLAHGLCFQLRAVIRAARLPDPCEEQAKVIIDLGDGADRRARVVRG